MRKKIVDKSKEIAYNSIDLEKPPALVCQIVGQISSRFVLAGAFDTAQYSETPVIKRRNAGLKESTPISKIFRQAWRKRFMIGTEIPIPFGVLIPQNSYLLRNLPNVKNCGLFAVARS